MMGTRDINIFIHRGRDSSETAHDPKNGQFTGSGGGSGSGGSSEGSKESPTTGTSETTNTLYQRALKSGTSAHHMLKNGDKLICSVDRVAGRSIVGKHSRVTWHRVAKGDQYSKPLSKEKAATMLKENNS